MVSSSAAASPLPARSLRSTTAQMTAESQRASSASTSPAGRAAASVAPVSGQPLSAPLWLNSQRSAAYGAAAVSPASVSEVASRTAASTARLLVTLARSANVGSDQIGLARRYLAGTGAPSAYQPTPKPSAFTTPCRCRRGAQACACRLYGGSVSSERSVASLPR